MNLINFFFAFLVCLEFCAAAIGPDDSQADTVVDFSLRTVDKSVEMDRLLSTPTGYAGVQFYSSSDCSSEVVLTVAAAALGECVYDVITTASGNVVTLTYYTDTSCSTVDQTKGTKGVAALTIPSGCLTSDSIESIFLLAGIENIFDAVSAIAFVPTYGKFVVLDSYSTAVTKNNPSGLVLNQAYPPICHTTTGIINTWVTFNKGASIKYYSAAGESLVSCAGSNFVLSVTGRLSEICLTAAYDYLYSTCLTASTTSAGSSSSKSCFAAHETVQLEDGSMKVMEEVVVGDRVLALDENDTPKFADVVFIPHKRNNDVATFLKFETEHGLSIKMTPKHLVFNQVCDKSDTKALVQASEVEVGSCLISVSGLERVVTKTTGKGQGVYTLVLSEPYLVVSGVVASPFEINHGVVNAYYNFHRLLYKTLPVAMTSSLVNVIHHAAETLVSFF